MSNDTFAQSGQAAVPPSEAEYNAVYAAVTATERGRWFLAEFADRNRKADTDLILAAIARIDEAVRTGTAPQAAVAREAALAAAPAVVAQLPPAGGERDEDDAVAAVIASAAPVEPRQDTPQVAVQVAQPDTQATVQAHKDADYSDAVPAFWPRFQPHAARDPHGFRWPLYMKNQEYQAAAGFAAGVLFLVWKMLR